MVLRSSNFWQDMVWFLKDRHVEYHSKPGLPIPPFFIQIQSKYHHKLQKNNFCTVITDHKRFFFQLLGHISEHEATLPMSALMLCCDTGDQDLCVKHNA